MKIHEDILYVGVNDYDVALFEGQYPLDNGMAYNSYLIIDEKVALLDTVEKKFKDEWLNNIKKELKGRTIDYLIIHHMEPDHSSNIVSLVNEYRDVIIVSSLRSFTMMKNYFGNDFSERRIVIDDLDTLSLGKHELTFYLAPMVHWPEVMMSYDFKSKVLFSSDAFGKFGVNDKLSEWKKEARRYYFGIIGKYGKQVNNVLKKIENLDIDYICSLHGNVLKGNIDYYLDTYKLWANYNYEEEGLVIAYTSVYGNTKEFIDYLVNKLNENGYKRILVFDLINCDIFDALAMSFRYSKLLLASITYNNNLFPKMREFINHLKERNYQNRSIALIENGSFSLNAINTMKNMLSDLKNITFIEPNISILSTLSLENIKDIDLLIKNIKGE